jgi:signal peptidase I
MMDGTTPNAGVAHDADVYLKVVREVLHQDQSAGPLRLPVVSDSMRPLLRAGDWVIIEAATPAALRFGDIIVVQRGKELITHRVVAQDEQGWHTHGDNTRMLDQVVRAEEIVGRVSAIERGSQRVELQSPHWQTANRWIGKIDRAKLSLLQAGRVTPLRSASWLAPVASWPFQMVLRCMVTLELIGSRRKS